MIHQTNPTKPCRISCLTLPCLVLSCPAQRKPSTKVTHQLRRKKKEMRRMLSRQPLPLSFLLSFFLSPHLFLFLQKKSKIQLEQHSILSNACHAYTAPPSPSNSSICLLHNHSSLPPSLVNIASASSCYGISAFTFLSYY